jgi:hypothetical protein
MVQNETDQRWQELQERIDNVFGRLLRGDIRSIEYKPQFAVPLLEMTSCAKHGVMPCIGIPARKE